MDYKITLDMLTDKSVSVVKQGYAVIDGTPYAVGEPHRCAYVNSEHGRAEIEAELPAEYAQAVLAVWGDAPTVVEGVEE